MTYATVPNTFTSATTLFAASINSNFTALVNALSDGTKSLNVYNIDCSTMIVSGAIAVTNTAIAETNFNVAGTTTTTDLTGKTTTSIIGLSTPEALTVSSGAITPTQSNVKVTGTSLTSIVPTNFISGSLLVLSAAGTLVVTSNATIILDAATRTLNHVADKLVLQLIGSVWYELQFQSNA